MNNTAILAALGQAMNDPTFKKRTKDTVLGIMTDAQNYIIDKTECLRQVDSTSVVPAADTMTYALPNTFVKFPTEGTDVKRGFVSLGTYGKYPLTFLPLTILNNRYPGWRQTASGTPGWYSVIDKGTPQLIIYPAPSTAFITSAGAVAFMDVIYKPAAALLEDSGLPFDGAYRYNGLFQILLKLRSIWQMKLEDMQFADADRLSKSTDGLFDEATDFVRSLAASPGHHGFEENMA